MDINQLLDALGSMFPLSTGFSITLPPLMHPQSGNHKQELLIPPNRATFAWFILEGIVIAVEPDQNGIEQVIRIYLPGSIFTDFRSFLNDKRSTIRLVAIGDINLMYISREDFKNHMEPFPETHKLVEHILFLEQELEAVRTRLMALIERERIKEFARIYPMNKIPNVSAASFLQMSEANYCREKARYNSTNRDY
jgi:CRP-like cAMP-binding protein